MYNIHMKKDAYHKTVQVDFGYQRIDPADKPEKVQAIFDSVAHNYDRMNDLMSLGLHHLWKKRLVEELQPHRHLLDIAGGTGDIALAYLNKNGKHATLCDLTHAMLAQGQKRILNDASHLRHQLSFINGDAENLPFAPKTFDYVTIAFGLRNMTFKQQALQSAWQVLKPGGKIFILEFSPVNDATLAKFYDWWSFSILPTLGKWIANDADSYQYLAESIREFPPAEQLQQMLMDAGFTQCGWQYLNMGIVAIHSGYRTSHHLPHIAPDGTAK